MHAHLLTDMPNIKKKSILADASESIIVKNMKEKGDIYELYILDYLQTENPKRHCWLWNNIPEEVMCDVGLIGNWNEHRLQRKSNRVNKLPDGKPIYGLPENHQSIAGLDGKLIYGLPDVGCDIFMIEPHLENNAEHHLIQCKYYAENNTVKLEDLAGWNSMLVDYPEMFGDLYYTSKLSENIKARKPNPRIRYFHKQYESNVIVETNTNATQQNKPKDAQINTKLDTKQHITFNFILGNHNLDNQFENRIEKQTAKQTDNKTSNKSNIDIDIDIDKFANYNLKPYNYQLDAYNALVGKKRTVLQLPCGMGKTLISIMLSDGEKLVVFISPLKAFCQQNMERFTEQLPEYKCVIVDSEGTRDIDELEGIVVNSAGQKTALFATYKSLDVIMQLYDKQLLNNAYFIIDEFHNIPYDDAICYDEDEYIDGESILEDGEIDITDNDIGESDENISENDDLQEDGETEVERDSFDDAKEEDMEDEKADTNIKTPMYRLLHSDARILFMSATPRLFEESDETAEGMDIDNEIFGEVDYSYPMGKAISEGYVADYMIYVPTMAIKKDEGLDAVIEELSVKDFDKELLIKSRFIIRGCMGTGSRKCIIYCADQKECAEMMKMITELCKSYFAIDCWVDTITSVDNREKRKAKLKQFKDVREIAFLCSVDILNECVDIPVCDSIFITYVSKSRIRNIQRLCRANRKCAGNPNKIASIFLWCDEYAEMACFMKHLKEYDERFIYEKVKRICGSDVKGSSIMKVGDSSDDKKVLDGVIVGFKSVAGWMENLEKVKQYIDKNGRRPSETINPKLCSWIQTQRQNAKKRLQIMKSDIIYQEWNNFINDARYKKYFQSNEEDWINNLDELKKFIDNNKSRPTPKSNNKLRQWVSAQLKNFKTKLYIMKIDEIYNLWNEFINNDRYKKYFLSNEDDWKNKLEELKQFINTYNARPTVKTHIKLCDWISLQRYNFKTNKGSMKNNEIYNLWNEFMNDATYKKYFQSNEEEWKNNLDELKQFINTNNVRPTVKTDKILDKWISTQLQNSKTRIQIMKNDEIYNLWNEFINDTRYKKYFNLDNIRDWKNKIEEVKKFIDTNNAKPTSKTNMLLARWISTQLKSSDKRLYIMKIDEIYNLWNEFINDVRYKKYFDLDNGHIRK